MPRHLLRFAFLLALLVGAGLLGTALLAREEMVIIEWNGWILHTRAWVVATAAGVTLIAGWLAISLVLGLLRTPRTLRNAIRTRRRERGLQALGRAFTAYAAEDGRAALANARRAERLLADPRITRPLVAKSLEMSGRSREAREYFVALAENPETAGSGTRGLLAAAGREGEVDTAITQARRLVDLQRADPEGHRQLLALLAGRRAWPEARQALADGVRHRAWDRAEARRLEAAAAAAEAEEAEAAGRPARSLAQLAAELDPGLAPAACQAARLLAGEGERKRAERLLLAAWRAEPTPELAQAWAALEPGEVTSETVHRHRRRLIDAHPGHRQARLTAAEFAVTRHDWDAAREALGDLPLQAPTARACAAMAAIEKAGNRDPAAARRWLARALEAPRDSHWTCGECGAVTDGWAALCPGCGAFAAIARREVVAGGRAGPANLLPHHAADAPPELPPAAARAPGPATEPGGR